MEKLTEEDNQLTKVRSTNAIRCARAAFLISSLRNPCIDSTAISSQLQDEKQIEKLKINLVKETLKIRKLRFLIKVSFLSFLLFTLVLFICFA